MSNWDKSLETGITEIDQQHKQLFDLTDKVLLACKEGKGKSVIEESLNFLETYVKKHFSAEEKLQKQSKYPLYEKHKAMHDHFNSELDKLKDTFDKQGATLPVTIGLSKLINGWLREHINKVDKELAGYIKSSN